MRSAALDRRGILVLMEATMNEEAVPYAVRTSGLPGGLTAVLERVERGETTVEDAGLLRQGLRVAFAVVTSGGGGDSVQFFRDLARLRAWFLGI